MYPIARLGCARVRQPFSYCAPALVALALASTSVKAHSGGLNASGCHAGSRPYHCHRAPSEMVVTSTGHTRLRCDLGSRSRECVGVSRRTPKVQASPRVLNLQIQLRRHCAGLPRDFADGLNGPLTQRALVAFQRSQGLTPDGLYGPDTSQALSRAPNGLCRL